MSDDRVLPSIAKSIDEYMAAVELEQDGYLEEAEKHARKSLEIKRNIDAMIILIDILEKQGKDSSEWRKVLLEEYPTNPETYRRLFLSSFDSDKEAALSFINKAITLLKKPQYYHDKALLLYSMGRYIEAIASIDIAIKAEPKNPLFWGLRAKILYSMGKISESLEACEASLRLNARDRDSLLISAKIFLELGEKEKARERLLRIDSVDEEVKKLIEMSLS
ncbi:MAG: tetratricopeptide repeat protein [Thermoplasmatales archaeon]